MKVTYSADAYVQEAEIEGIVFRAGETHDVPDHVAEAILRNVNFTDEKGRNAYSPADAAHGAAPAATQHVQQPPPHSP